MFFDRCRNKRKRYAAANYVLELRNDPMIIELRFVPSRSGATAAILRNGYIASAFYHGENRSILAVLYDCARHKIKTHRVYYQRSSQDKSNKATLSTK